LDFWEPELSASRPDSNDIAALAAAHAALDPERQEWRSDILVSSMLEILGSRGPLTERELHQHIRDLWCTNVITQALLHETLAVAEKEGLVERRQRSRSFKWAATEETVANAKNDKKWAEKLLAGFEHDVAARINDLLEGPPVDPAYAKSLARRLLAAMRMAAKNVFDSVIRADDPSKLTGIDLDPDAARSYLRDRVNPDVAERVVALAQAAFDPGDSFGADILHVIVTGQVLQGMLARRDLREPLPVADSLLLLDTSTLVYRIDAAPQPQLFNEFMKASVNAGCRIAVTRPVIKEWESLWSAAAKGVPDLENSSTGLPSSSWRFAENPVLRSWRSKAEDGRPQQWEVFQRNNRGIESWLRARGVHVIEDGRADPELVEKARKELARLSDAAPVQLRTPAAARTDAYSAALVAEARDGGEAPIPNAWLIAQDQLTNKAYATIRPSDHFPLSSTVEAWIILLSAVQPDNGAKDRGLAEILSDSVILNNFISVSACFGPEELREIADVLNKAPGTDPDELAGLVRADYIALADGKDLAAALARRQAVRRNRRAWRMAEQAEETRKETDNERRARAREVDQLRKEFGLLLKAQNRQWRRLYCLSLALAAIAFGIAFSALAGAPFWVVVVAAVGWIAIGIQGIRWLRKPKVSAVGFILATGATIAWTVLASVLGIALSQSADHRGGASGRSLGLQTHVDSSHMRDHGQGVTG
jgi:DNA-binding HxlR family transcriptional regulator